MKNSNETIGNRTRDLPVCSTLMTVWKSALRVKGYGCIWSSRNASGPAVGKLPVILRHCVIIFTAFTSQMQGWPFFAGVRTFHGEPTLKFSWALHLVSHTDATPVFERHAFGKRGAYSRSSVPALPLRAQKVDSLSLYSTWVRFVFFRTQLSAAVRCGSCLHLTNGCTAVVNNNSADCVLQLGSDVNLTDWLTN
jgi:hypothetical protein